MSESVSNSICLRLCRAEVEYVVRTQTGFTFDTLKCAALTSCCSTVSHRLGNANGTSPQDAKSTHV
eukprot:5421129-Amphidinium_carterae.1